MPPYQNESLHDMHALMQQLDTLNAGHAPEHLEMFEGMRDAVKNNKYAKKIADAAAAVSKKAGDAYTTAIGKDVDTEKQWSAYTTVDPKITVLENTFIDIIGALRRKGQDEWTVADVDALKKTIQGNSKAKVLLERNIVAIPILKATTHRPPAEL